MAEVESGGLENVKAKGMGGMMGDQGEMIGKCMSGEWMATTSIQTSRLCDYDNFEIVLHKMLLCRCSLVSLPLADWTCCAGYKNLKPSEINIKATGDWGISVRVVLSVILGDHEENLRLLVIWTTLYPPVYVPSMLYCEPVKASFRSSAQVCELLCMVLMV